MKSQKLPGFLLFAAVSFVAAYLAAESAPWYVNLTAGAVMGALAYMSVNALVFRHSDSDIEVGTENLYDKWGMRRQ